MRLRHLLAFLSSILLCLTVSPAFAADANSLPLRQGYYVIADTPCGSASNATLSLLSRSGFGASRGDGAFTKIVPTGSAIWRVTTSTIVEGSSRPQISTVTIKADGPAAYTMTNDFGAFTYRYCPQASLPEPWRTNDLSSYINPSAGAMGEPKPAETGSQPGAVAVGTAVTAHWSVDRSPAGRPIARLSVLPAAPIRAIELACLDDHVALGVLVAGQTRLTVLKLAFSAPGRAPIMLAAPRMGQGSTFAATLADAQLVELLMAGKAGTRMSIGRFSMAVPAEGAAQALSQSLAKCRFPKAR